jgi:hypothetical protein
MPTTLHDSLVAPVGNSQAGRADRCRNRTRVFLRVVSSRELATPRAGTRYISRRTVRERARTVRQLLVRLARNCSDDTADARSDSSWDDARRCLFGAEPRVRILLPPAERWYGAGGGEMAPGGYGCRGVIRAQRSAELLRLRRRHDTLHPAVTPGHEPRGCHHSADRSSLIPGSGLLVSGCGRRLDSSKRSKRVPESMALATSSSSASSPCTIRLRTRVKR